MNQVSIIGRLTKDPDVRYTQNQTAIARFSVAINRGKDKNGEDRGADFPNVLCMGKIAELAEKYLSKGRLVGVSGHIQTGKYEKDGRTIYTTDIFAERVEFLDRAPEGKAPSDVSETAAPDGFARIDDEDIPF